MDSQIIFYVLFGILAVWCLVLTIMYTSQQKFFAQFLSGVSKKDLRSLLESIDKKLIDQQQELDQAKKDIQLDRVAARKHMQKFAMVRFNPFDETGGDQSFTLSLLDADNEGFVVTSLHSRDATRVYAKQVDGKQKKLELSKEEQDALSRAMKGS